MNLVLYEKVRHGTPEFPFAIYDIQPIAHISLHWHQEAELIYVVSGEVRIHIMDKEYLAHAGDLFFVNPEEIHGMETVGAAHYGTILFPYSFLLFESTDAVMRDYLLPLSQHRLLFSNVIPDSELKDRLFHMTQTMLSVYRMKQGSYRLTLKAMALTILSLLVSSDCLYENPALENHHQTYQKQVLSYLQENYKEPIRLEDIADHFQVSYKYFSRSFHQMFGITLSHYLLNLRMEEASHLLEDTDMSVTDIAMEVGFNQDSFFIRSFRKIYGITPLKYRKKQK